ncbi:hypothetical protein KQI84_17025 [bacterium]|nr:hypothetical protein [bacterium]
MLDKIIEGYLLDFKEDHMLTDLPDAEAFEKLVNYAILSRFSPGSVDVDCMDTGQGDDFHIDGIAILVNGNLISTEAELAGIIKNRKNISVDFIFTQAKTSPTFSLGDILKFGHGVSAFFSESADKPMTDKVRVFCRLKDELYKNSIRFSNSPECHVFFVSTGT